MTAPEPSGILSKERTLKSLMRLDAFTALRLIAFTVAITTRGSCLPESRAAAPSTAPNFVIVYVDDAGYADIGCFGAKGIRTPNLDRMAKDGRRFTSFCVAQGVCSASRTALLTGCYPNRVGILGALGPRAKVGISHSEHTIAQVLKPLGYRSAIFGKWHLGHHPKFLPTHHGFDEYFGIPYSNDMGPRPGQSGPNGNPPLPLIEGDKVVETNPDISQLTTRYTERA